MKKNASIPCKTPYCPSFAGDFQVQLRVLRILLFAGIRLILAVGYDRNVPEVTTNCDFSGEDETTDRPVGR